MRLGIDFGTTRTVVAAVDEGRYPLVAFDIGGSFQDWLPGIAIWSDGGLRFGEDAARDVLSSEGALASIKRTLSSVPPDALLEELGHRTTALDLAAAYLQWIRWMLVHRSNLDLGEDEALQAMVAVPANASSRQRYVTIEAFKRAGFEVVGMLNEPTAAAIEFAHRHTNVLSPRSPKRYVVVYDLGGGTFDTAAVSLVERRFSLLTSRGIAQLGGADFDRIILEAACEAIDVDPQWLDPVIRVELLERCREAKEALRPNSRRLLVDFSGLDPLHEGLVLETAAVYERCAPLIGQTQGMVDELFASLSAKGIDTDDPRQLGALYLVGGASAFPPLARMLREQYGRKIQLAPQPHAATAIGLAVASDEDAGIFVREALTRHFGVWREGNSGIEKVFDPIMSKDTLVEEGPLVVERRYRPTHAVGHLRFLECSELGPAGEPAGDVTPWEDVRFPYAPELAAAECLENVPIARLSSDSDVVETYVHHLDGTIAVNIENRTHGYQRSYTLGAPRVDAASRSA